MFETMIDRFDRVDVKVDRLEERLRLIEGSSSIMREIMEGIDARINNIMMAGKINTLIYCYIVDKFIFPSFIKTILVKSALHCRETCTTTSL